MTNFDKLVSKLSELFELEKADLDFGIHRIIKARQKQIRIFLGLEQPPASDSGAPTLEKIVQREMGELNTVDLKRQLDSLTAGIQTDYGKLAFDGDGKLSDGPAKESEQGQLWIELKEQLDSGSAEANLQLEAEIYSHLTEFFSRYYDEADFLSKRRIKAGDAPYAVPYSGEEVMLHWANKDQYYIKSSKDLKDYTFTLPERFEGKRVQFKCQRQDPILNNNKAKREFHIDDEAEIEIADDHLVIPFHFKIVDKTRTQKDNKEWIEGIVDQLPAEWQQALKHKPDGAAKDLITRHLDNYTRKNESDYFIHKHLGKFLRGELDFYIKNEVMHLDDIDAKSIDYLTTRVRLIKALRTIAQHIITFLAQLENFQKKLWLKKKYVTETHYCITLDRLFDAPDGEALIATVLEHLETKIRRYDGELRSQQDEWIKLYAIDELEDYPEDGKLTAEFLQAHDKMMVDTVFYPDSFKWQLLSNIDDLDDSLDGLLVHSENFQALNLLLERYREKIKCIYIDPPYNTGNDGFPYKENYLHSSWLTCLSNLCPQFFLHNEGYLFASIDDHEQHRLTMLLQQQLGADQFESLICHKSRDSVSNDLIISKSHNGLLLFSKKHSIAFGKKHDFGLAPNLEGFSNPDNDPRGDWKPQPTDGPGGAAKGNPYYTYKGVTGYFRFSLETMKEMDERGELIVRTNSISSKNYLAVARKKRSQVTSWWNDCGTTTSGTKALKRIFGECPFKNPKPIGLVSKAIDCAGRNNTLTFDYFAGSGTTAHAVIDLNRQDKGNRKYILAEMGFHFDSVLKPRTQKVVYSKDWKEGKPESFDTGISHAFKYLRLESYEDALNNLDLGEDRTPDLLGLSDQVREDYLFSYLLDVETRGHLMSLKRFRDPWGCQLKIHDPHTGKSEPRVIDLIETFNYLIGVTVREIKVQDGFLTIEGESPAGETILIVWRKLEGESDWPTTDNAALKTFITERRRINTAATEYHTIYINGDHTLEDPQSKIHCIEEEFYERMFENTGNPED
jgi:adenine-specific DNA-methyltransferase